jgi:hypothetical protein
MLMSLVLCSCSAAATNYTHDHRFTIPFKRDVTLTIWEPQERSVELRLGVPEALLAPGDVEVLSVRHDEIVLSDLDGEVIMVMDDIDELDIRPGAYLCGGELIGDTKQVRIRAYWGQEQYVNASDLSLVRIVRNSVVTDLSDVNYADQVHSALQMPDSRGLRSDVNWGECPFGGSDE